MDSLTHEDLTIEVLTPPGPGIHAHWQGKSGSRDPAKVLLPWFSGLLELAKSRKARVELHFEKLEHFNSSTIAALIQVINDARDRKISLVMHYDGALRWQAASFEALKRSMKLFAQQGEGQVEFVSTHDQ